MNTAKKTARRFGCGLLLMLWFIGMVVLPCSALTLASGSEIRLTRSDVPDDYSLRIWLIQQSHVRGLGLSTGYADSPGANVVCTITDTHFIMWEGTGAASQNCACYDHQANGSYTTHSLGADACQLAGK